MVCEVGRGGILARNAYIQGSVASAPLIAGGRGRVLSHLRLRYCYLAGVGWLLLEQRRGNIYLYVQWLQCCCGWGGVRVSVRVSASVKARVRVSVKVIVGVSVKPVKVRLSLVKVG